MRTQTKTKEVWLTQAQYDARQTAGTLVEGVVYHITDSKIAKSELASDVQTSLGKADSAIQSHQDISGKENTSNKTTTLTASSTTTQYPSAKTVYDAVLAVREIAEGKKDTYVISDVTNPSFNTQNTQVTIDKTQTTITDINGNVIDYTKMQVGDSVYITQTDVPDRWVSSMVGNNITFDKLETAKVPVLDVKVNGTTVVNNSVANIDLASKADITYVDEQIARAINPKDLSYYDIYGIYTLTRNTANCYVVSNQGKYMFPLVYGNAIKNGQTNAASYTNGGGQYQAAFVNYNGVQITNPYIEIDTNTSAVSAELCLADANNIFTGVSLQTINGLKYVVFNVASVPHTGANGIIGVKDANGDIMWSWHIWVWEDSLQTVEFTNHTGVKYNMLPVNLASTWGDDTKNHIKNWHYQWGRKDPMCPPSAYNSTTNATLYGSKTFEATSADTVAEAIKRPHNFFKQYDTTSYNWNPLTYFWNFWNAHCNYTGADDNLSTAVKTIYDPCPYGFIIPVGRTFTGFTTTGGNSSTQSEFNVVDGFTHGWKFKANSADAVGQFFPASGSRNRESGGLGDVGSLGYYWSSASGSQAYEYRLYFNIGNVFTLNDEPRTGGFSVRPCKEYSL